MLLNPASLSNLFMAFREGKKYAPSSIISTTSSLINLGFRVVDVSRTSVPFWSNRLYSFLNVLNCSGI